jgi:hypothetical protein
MAEAWHEIAISLLAVLVMIVAPALLILRVKDALTGRKK